MFYADNHLTDVGSGARQKWRVLTQLWPQMREKALEPEEELVLLAPRQPVLLKPVLLNSKSLYSVVATAALLCR